MSATTAPRVSTTLLSSSVKVVSANVSTNDPTSPMSEQPAVSVTVTPGNKSMGIDTTTVGVRRSSTKGATITSSVGARTSVTSNGSNRTNGTITNSIDVSEMSDEDKKKLEERRRSSLARKGSQGIIMCDVTVGDDKITTKQEIILEEEPAAAKKESKCCVIL